MTKPKTYEASPLIVKWTDKDAKLAQREGWDIFDCCDHLEIEICDESPGRFDHDGDNGDLDAVHYVIRKALSGSKTHIAAVLHLLVNSTDMFVKDIKELKAHGFLTTSDRAGRISAKDSKPTLMFLHNGRSISVYATQTGADIFVAGSYLTTIQDDDNRMSPNEWASKALEYYLHPQGNTSVS